MTLDTVAAAPTPQFINYISTIEELVPRWSPEHRLRLIDDSGAPLYRWLREMVTVHVGGHRQSGKTHAVIQRVDPERDIVLVYNAPHRKMFLNRLFTDRGIDMQGRCFSVAQIANAKLRYFSEEQSQVLGPARRVWMDDASWYDSHLETKYLYHEIVPVCDYNTVVVKVG